MLFFLFFRHLLRALSRLVLIVFCGLLASHQVSAVIPVPKNPNDDLIPTIGVAESAGGTANVIDGLGLAVSQFIGIAAVLGIIGITWGGIMMILSVGNDEKVKKARWIMIYAVIGTVIAAGAYVIVNIVANLTLKI